MSPSRQKQRRAFTLVEMLMAIMVMTMIAMGLAALSTAVGESSEHTLGYGNAMQHARVALERIERKCRESVANQDFPGFIVLSQQIGSYKFPDTLVIWSPSGDANDPDGLPQFNELVLYFPNPDAPNELLEVTVPGDSRTVPNVSDTATWQAELVALQASNATHQVVLTDLLYSADAGGSAVRGAVRFQSLQWPPQLYIDYYEAKAMSWDMLPFTQGVKNKESGLAHNACKIELFLLPDDRMGDGVTEMDPVPFFGSAGIYYLIYKST